MSPEVDSEREQALTALRDAVKASRWTYRDIAGSAGKTSDWIGEVMRGNYPHYKAHRLPKNIRLALERLGFHVPECLKTF